MRKVLLLLIGLIALGCSKSEDKIVPKDIEVSWTYIENEGKVDEKYVNLAFSYDEYILTVIDKLWSKTYVEKGNYSYDYPNLLMISKGGSFKVKGTINEKKDRLTLYDFESIYFIPKTKNIVLKHRWNE
jgi:lipoprotein|nr:MAG TPA: PLAT/LH2 and C2-like Ca2+-binding lipoprotein [Caudoviricetes sp.]